MQTVFESPIGVMTLAFDDVGVTGLDFTAPSFADAPNDIAVWAMRELNEYFAGARKLFTVPVHAEGAAFRKAAWAALSTIPYGKTATYGQVAAQIGSPGAARAVGTACRLNPVSVIVPCHRVVHAGGGSRYGGGVWRKEWLLKLEAENAKTLK